MIHIKHLTSRKYQGFLNKYLVDMLIQPGAIITVMEDIVYYKKLINYTNESNDVILVKILASQNRYTLVAHPVSYDYDDFSKGQNSLENKKNWI